MNDFKEDDEMREILFRGKSSILAAMLCSTFVILANWRYEKLINRIEKIEKKGESDGRNDN